MNSLPPPSSLRDLIDRCKYDVSVKTFSRPKMEIAVHPRLLDFDYALGDIVLSLKIWSGKAMAQTSPKVTVTYSIEPPDGLRTTGSLKKESKIEADVHVPSTSGYYYENLRSAVAEAKARVGVELTLWRDVVGNLENAKEAKKASKTSTDEDEAEEEFEEE